MVENLAAKGIKRKQYPEADLQTIREYHPEVLASLAVLSHRMGIFPSWLFELGHVSGFITSGYRDRPVDARIKNSPHYFALALDVAVGNAMRQIEWGRRALEDKLFYRVGLYPQNGFIHLDLCDADWMRKYHGAPYWVRYNNNYYIFHHFEQAAKFSLDKIAPGG